MNIDKYIKMLLIKLSKKYNISLVEITKIKDNKIKRTINFNYRLHTSKPKDNKKETFYNKRELLRWLSCLE